MQLSRTIAGMRLRQLTVAVHIAFAGVAAVSLPQAVFAQSAKSQYNIPAGPLSDALSRFAQQAGVAISFDAGSLKGVQTGGLQGMYGVEEGFNQLLRSTGYAIGKTSAGYVLTASPDASNATVSAPADAVLPAVQVKGSVESPTGPGTGLVASRSVSGTKTNTSILETPQTISIVTRAQMDAQGATTLVESLRYTPGIVTQYGNTDLRLDWLTLRGFTPPARYLDGLRLPFGARGYSQPRIEPWGLERVEVVKGPSSVLYGQTTPGGLVNSVSKRPTAEQIRQVEVQLGNHDRKQFAFDLGGALDEEAVWSYRLVGLHRDSDTAYDHVYEKKTYIAPSLTYRPSAATQITILAHWQELDSPGGGGAPALPVRGTLDTSVYPALPRSTFVGEPGFDHFKNRQRFVGYEAEHKIDDTFTVRQNLRYGKVDADTQRVQAFCLSATSCNPAALNRYAWAFPESAEMLHIDTHLQADLQAGSLKHKVLAGLDFSKEKSRFDETNLRVLGTTFNAYNPVYGLDSGVVPSVATHIDQDRQQLGFYLQDQMQLGAWRFVVGGRYDKARTSTRTLTTATGNTIAAKQNDGQFTGRMAVMYDVGNGLMPYLSYSTSFQPAAGTNRFGGVFDPTEGKQIEAGLKYQASPDTMLTASVYELTQQNVLTPDSVNTSFNEQTGEVTVRGLELEARGKLSSNIEAIASYAYTDSEVTKANPNGAGVSTKGNRFAYVPEHQAALWLDYSLPFESIAGLTIGGGARRTSNSYGDNANLFKIPGVTLFDMAIRWDLSRISSAWKGTTLSLNIANLTDKTYVATCLGVTGCYYGEGRTMYLSARYRW